MVNPLGRENKKQVIPPVDVRLLSGPLHLACPLATATVSQMGPTFPDRGWPIGEDHKVLRLGVAYSPSSLGRCSHHACLRALDVDLVFKVVRDESLL